MYFVYIYYIVVLHVTTPPLLTSPCPCHVLVIVPVPLLASSVYPRLLVFSCMLHRPNTTNGGEYPPSTVDAALRRCVKVQRIGANYDPITSGKMDDLVSRIINVSMDLYFYYIPITVGNENAFNEFRVYAPRWRGEARRAATRSRPARVVRCRTPKIPIESDQWGKHIRGGKELREDTARVITYFRADKLQRR